MTESELERIKSAYYSGLKVQIWSCGNWSDFDAREYPYGGFSTMRQYRIVGSEYAEKAEAEIKRLEKECNEAKEIIKKYLVIGVGGKITQNYLDVTKEAEQFLKDSGVEK